MSKHTKKYIQIINTARDLFWKFGIRRVTIEEICEKAEVSKMTFYKYFSNKADLVMHLIDDIYSDNMVKYTAIINSSKPYKEKVYELAVLKMEATSDISHEFLSDYYSLFDDELSGYLQQKVRENLEIMLQDFIKVQENGDIRKDIKPEFIMYFLNNLVTMGKDPALNSLYPDARDMIMELMNFFFYGILPRNPEV
ncbi:MAG: TetR/AcrR family transcriptional regulator [Marinilabiliaceae bacterium]|jgi:AcrR family transcriptional regulator|nr:TetR/AcrR family transcriptional regulator [Marinilabiliaceae bacterium]